MAQTVDYYLAPQSPWTYLGHERFVRIARDAGAGVRVLPMDLGGKVFPVSGGLPLGQRAPQRRAYRLVELKRFSDHLRMPMNLQPKFFPVAGDDAARLIITVDERDGADAALQLTGAVLAAVWAQERDIASAITLGELLRECALSGERLEQSRDAAAQQRYEQNTQAAIDAGVFGAPSYVVGGEIFWGQDRLDFLQRKLSSAN
ncbi:MAG TPA: 2-hydroxychromene-2-carboxylate isomerase [Ramlibacter sp.]|nr:2-hydroxychromene-2-carboxylate isomerase [Ramlibacter sp.]